MSSSRIINIHCTLALAVVFCRSVVWADEGGILPFELAFDRSQFVSGDNKFDVSPDGEQIAYVVHRSAANLDRNGRFTPGGTPAKLITSQIFLTGKTGEPVGVCASGGANWNPSWSPAGDLLAFYSSADGPVQLWVYEARTGVCRKVSASVIKSSIFGDEIHWSPDGRAIYVPLDQDPAVDHSIDGLSTLGGISPVQAGSSTLVYESGDEAGKSATKVNLLMHGEAIYTLLYNYTLGVIDTETGKTTVLAAADTKPHPGGSISLSGAGYWLSYESSPNVQTSPAVDVSVRKVDLVVMTVSGDKRQTLVTDLPFLSSQENYRWHPGEPWLFYLKGERLWQVNFDGSGPKKAKELAAGQFENSSPEILGFSRDGRTLVLKATKAESDNGEVSPRLVLVPLDGGKVSQIALPDSNKWTFQSVVTTQSGAVWQPQGKTLTLYLQEKSSKDNALIRIDPATGRHTLLWRQAAQISSLGASDDHRFLMGVCEDVNTPPDICRFSSDVSSQQRISRIEPRLENIRKTTTKVIETTVPRHDGGLERIQSSLLLPAGAKRGDRLPAVVMVYGGGDLSKMMHFFGGWMGNSTPNLLYTSRGYAVLMSNIPIAMSGDTGRPVQQMAEVLLPQVYRAAELGYIDINRVAISGHSYGGYSAAAIVTQTNLFRAGIALNGIYDLGAVYGRLLPPGNSPWGLGLENMFYMGEHPWENVTHYTDNSPYYQLDKIHTPLFIVVGERDRAALASEGKKLFVGLRRLQRPARLAVYPEAGHVVSLWSTVDAEDVSKRIFDFLEKHLGKPET